MSSLLTIPLGKYHWNQHCVKRLVQKCSGLMTWHLKINYAFANCAFNRRMLKTLSALYLLDSGNMTDIITLCMVAPRVACGILSPIHHRSEIISADDFKCLAWETKVLLSGISSLAGVVISEIFRLILAPNSTNARFIEWINASSLILS